MIIAPSILSMDFTKFSQQLEQVNQSKATWIHFDVMDGHFVPNLTFGPDILKAVKKVSPLFCDVHLMVNEPMKFIDMFIKAQADQITFHLEACESQQQVFDCIAAIKANGCKVGISIKPTTEVDALIPYIALVDLILIMSVEPGFGGQAFIEATYLRIKQTKQLLQKANNHALIQVDGGINQATAKACLASGVDVLVAGSYVFNANIKEAIESIWQAS